MVVGRLFCRETREGQVALFLRMMYGLRMIAGNLLSPADPPVYDWIEGNGAASCLIICEHGGNALPAALGTLGLPSEDFRKHFAVDIGARTMAETLVSDLGLCGIFANYSRLAADLNRWPHAADTFAAAAEGKPVPGNLNLPQAEKDNRIARLYEPFHARIERWLDDQLLRNRRPSIVTVHSFTPVLNGVARPQEICVVSNADRRMADPVISAFRAARYAVGDNEPFDGRKGISATFNRHGTIRGLPNLMIEFRNDLLRDESRLMPLYRDTRAILHAALAGLRPAA
ncbi:MAG: N-formylglutamate amidohydrolase [Proteobacteria bacterium]|nr:N-formylglutamate amidohydrolase [Pseudomonadota bacterium]